MANTSPVYVRIDTNLKENAEKILIQLGISPSSAIQMFYSRIVLERGLPFNLHLPSSQPENVASMTQSELDAALEKGIESVRAGKTYTLDAVDAELKKKFGI
jgi:DNA-damage-inducible protein J